MRPRFSTAPGGGAVIVNQPGTSLTIGATKGAAARPDGHALALATVGPLATQAHLLRLSHGPDSSNHVCRTPVTPQLLAVRADAPFRTPWGLVEHGRSHHGTISLASTGIGSAPHPATIDLGGTAAFEWRPMPHNGDGAALQLALSNAITGWVAGVQTCASNMASLRDGRYRPGDARHARAVADAAGLSALARLRGLHACGSVPRTSVTDDHMGREVTPP